MSRASVRAKSAQQTANRAGSQIGIADALAVAAVIWSVGRRASGYRTHLNWRQKRMSDILRGFGTSEPVMRRFSKRWLAPILLSSIVTGGGSFALIALLTELPLTVVVAISAALVFVGDVVLAFLMQAVSPTRVMLGPGDREHNAEPPNELGIVATNFRNRRGHVSIRGETWRARQAIDCSGRLEAGGAVRIVERKGLTLIVAATQ